MIVKYCFVRCLSTKNAYFNSTNFEKVSYCCFLPIPEPLCSPRWEWAITLSMFPIDWRDGPDFHVFCRSSKCSNANSLMFDSEDFSFNCEHRRKPVSVFNSVLDYLFACEYRYWYLYSILYIFEYLFDYLSAEKREDSKSIL